MTAPTMTRVLPPERRSAATARRLVADVLEGWQEPTVVDDASLLASELVTNAVLHARSKVALVLRCQDDCVRIEAWDQCPDRPQPGYPDEEALTGRGLQLVDMLGQRWGVDPDGEEGKVVWVEVGFAHRGSFAHSS